MDKKTIITIIIATIFALIATFVIFKKNTTTTTENINVPQQQEEVVNTEETNDENAQSEIVAEENIEENKTEKTPVVKSVTKPAQDTTIKNNADETPVFYQIVVQEGSVVEEVEEDYGIKKVGNTIEVTREFKVKSPTNYSFKDFGILDKVTSK